MSSFLKTSPSFQPNNTSYGSYGGSNVNPYANYFGPQQPQPAAPAPQNQVTSPTSPTPQQFSFMSPPPAQNQNMSSFITSPTPQFSQSQSFSSPYQYYGGGSTGNVSFQSFASPTQQGNLGGQYFLPQAAQTRIIGGLNQSANAGHQSQSPPRYQGGSGGGGQFHYPNVSPSRTEESMGEPMHFSPVHSSPVYGGHSGQTLMGHHHSPTNTIMLPSYLLGLDQPTNMYHCPPSPSGGKGFMNMSSKTPRKVTFDPSSFPEDHSGSLADLQNQQKQKPKGPPIHGLGYSSEGSTPQEFLESPLITESKGDETSGNSPGGVGVYSPGGSAPSQSTPKSGSPSSAKCWVTIFGFPAGASSFIVTNFSTLGKIMEVKCTPGSNWLHIRFSNAIEARRALTRNGKVLGRSIMVGVIQSDASVIEEAERASFQNANTSSKSPMSGSGSVLRERNLDANSYSSDSIKTRIRPLGSGSLTTPFSLSNAASSSISPKCLSQMPSAARQAVQVEHHLDSNTAVPTASTGILTKAMEYMFGW